MRAKVEPQDDYRAVADHSPVEISYARLDTSMPGNGSLWRNGRQSLFGDRRARRQGDILTVVIEIDEEAQMANSINRKRQYKEGFDVSALMGLPEWAANVLPGGATLNPAIDLDRERSLNGGGTISRQEKITLSLAARVAEILPNGYMMITGIQEVRVNHETRFLAMSGTIRPEDLSRQNTITYEKIANARIYYGGRGDISRELAPRRAERLTNILAPF
ncbi:MAG: flagellar basal body L-ring protein FlgH [Parvularculaceae bacterium]